MREYVVLMLPVVWALVATFIGIILYRSSEAFFESVSGSRNKKKTLRLTGSVVIAVLAFYGIKSSTPGGNLYLNSPSIVQVSSEKLLNIRSKLKDYSDVMIAIESCMELDQAGNCKSQLVQQQKIIQSVIRTIDKILTKR